MKSESPNTVLSGEYATDEAGFPSYEINDSNVAYHSKILPNNLTVQKLQEQVNETRVKEQENPFKKGKGCANNINQKIPSGKDTENMEVESTSQNGQKSASAPSDNPKITPKRGMTTQTPTEEINAIVERLSREDLVILLTVAREVMAKACQPKEENAALSWNFKKEAEQETTQQPLHIPSALPISPREAKKMGYTAYKPFTDITKHIKKELNQWVPELNDKLSGKPFLTQDKLRKFDVPAVNAIRSKIKALREKGELTPEIEYLIPTEEGVNDIELAIKVGNITQEKVKELGRLYSNAKRRLLKADKDLNIQPILYR